MNVNLLASVALLLAMPFGTAAAETIQITPTSTAEIQGHDAYSRFLPGAFMAVPDGWTGGTSTTTPGAAGGGDASASGSADTSGLNTDQPGAATDSGLQGTDGDGGDAGPVGGGPSPGVGTVPLPPALPMFGAALLALCGLGAVRRRRAAGPMA